MDWINRPGKIQDKVKTQLHARKLDDLESIARLTKQFDLDGSGRLNQSDFTHFLAKAGIFLTTQELRTLYDLYDTNRDGKINYVEFIQIVRTEMTEKRLSVVKNAFEYLDVNGRGVLDISYLEKIYRPQEHPRAKTREKTPQQILAEFSNAIRKKSTDGRTVTESQFLDYYADVNATLPHEKEEYFVDLVINTWGITTSSNYVSQERLVELEVILYEKIRQKTVGEEDEGKVAKKAFKYFDLENKGVVDFKQFTLALEHFGCIFNPYEIQALFRKYENDSSGKIVYDEFSNFFACMGAGINANVHPVFLLSRIPPKDVLIYNMEDISKRGAHGIQELAIALRKGDKYNNERISRSDFTWATKEVGLLMAKIELDKLFNFLDKTCTNSIDYRVYLNLLRVPLNEAREAAVIKAFNFLDINHSSIIPVLTLVSKYNPYSSPKVKNGLESADFARQRFVKDFKGLNFIKLQDFIDYYTNLGTFIHNDDQFVSFVLESYKVPTESAPTSPTRKAPLKAPTQKLLSETGRMRVSWAK